MHTLPFQSVAPACVLDGHAVVEVPLSEIRVLRDAPVPDGAPPLPPRFLRHCDEQTVVGVRAVLEALAGSTMPRERLARHGVIAAPRFAGRITGAQTLVQAAAAGGIAVSPHVVPQCSLHALASAVSVALGMHGPNLGVSVGPAALSEGLFVAVTLAQSSGYDGMCVVFTEFDTEPALDAAGQPLGDPLCRGVAVVLRPATGVADGALTFTLGVADAMAVRDAGDSDCPSGLADFAWALGECAAGGVIASWSHVCPWGAEIRIAAPAAARAAGPVRREAA